MVAAVGLVDVCDVGGGFAAVFVAVTFEGELDERLDHLCQPDSMSLRAESRKSARGVPLLNQ